MYRSQVPRLPSLGRLIFGSYSSFLVYLPSVALLAMCSVDRVTYSINGMLSNIQAKTQGHLCVPALLFLFLCLYPVALTPCSFAWLRPGGQS